MIFGMNVMRHCDDYIDDPKQPECLREFLRFNRAPAVYKINSQEQAPTLYATYNGERVRVTMASRLGDVGITKDFTKDMGYTSRVSVEELMEFFTEP